MEMNLKKLIGHTSPKLTRELVEDHIKEIDINTKEKEVTVSVDRKYAFNNLHSSEHIGNLIHGIKKAFGSEYKTVLKLQPHLMKSENTEHHDREMNVPYMVHYM